MNKKVLALLMAVVMVAACVIIATPEAKAEDNHVNDHCICGGPNAEIEGMTGHTTCSNTVTWNPWNPGETHSSGYYYLTDNVTISALCITGDLYICLNGYKLHNAAADTGSLFYQTTNDTNWKLNICDCSENQTGVVENTSTATSVGAILSNGGSKRCLQITLWGGTFRGNPEVTRSASGLFDIRNNSTITIYKATLTAAKANNGGLIKTTSATGTNITIYGGNFYGGTATDTNGGGLIFASGALNIHGGNFYGGRAEAGHGGLIVGNGVTTITGGTFTGGYAKQNGGNMYLRQSNISGATITGGVAETGNGSNICISQKTAHVAGVDPTTVYGAASVIARPILDAGKAGLGIQVGATFAEDPDVFGVRFTLEGADNYELKLFELDLETFDPIVDLREDDGTATIWLANLLTAEKVHGNEKLTVQIYSSISEVETLGASLTTSMSELIAAAAQLEGLTAAQTAALAALQAMLPA